MFDFFRSYLSSAGSPPPLYVQYVSVYWFKDFFAITRFTESKYTKTLKVTSVRVKTTNILAYGK